jgi:hypothetical protein
MILAPSTDAFFAIAAADVFASWAPDSSSPQTTTLRSFADLGSGRQQTGNDLTLQWSDRQWADVVRASPDAEV